MADVTFLNLLRGNRLSGFLRLKMGPGAVYRLAKDYSYAELNYLAATNMDGEKLEGKILRNQTAELFADALIAPTHGHKALVTVNPELMRFASVPSMLLVDPVEKPIPVSMIARFTRDMDPGTLDWLYRVYLIS